MNGAPLFAKPDIATEARADGSRLLWSRTPLRPHEQNLGRHLERWANARPEAIFLRERINDDWRSASYADAWRAARAIGQALLARGLGPEQPVMVLSANGVDHGLLMLGCYVAGVPIVPGSVAYSLQSSDFAKLRHVVAVTRPGLLFVADRAPFEAALQAIVAPGVEVVTSVPDSRSSPFAELLETDPGPLVDDAFARIGADTVAKILFTSGSTGQPKGVLNTHGMLCANSEMLAQLWPFLDHEPPVLVDWLPWSHTFGGNNNFHLVLRSGGTLVIDAGKPAPGLIETTVRNLREISPTIYQNVPAGFAALLPYLERDDDLAERLFARLRLTLYAAAALSRDLWDRYDAVGRRVTGRPVDFTAGWGATETSPLATMAHFALDGPGNIGVPAPGVTVKLVPNGSKFELRVKGPNVMPGYVGEPALTREAFDDEGFYRIGDAGRFADPNDPTRGIVFDGRVAEDFKLTTGTWVSVGTLRPALLAATAPLLQDAVITGHDCSEVGALAWVSAAAAEQLFDIKGTPGEIASADAVRDRVRKQVAKHNSEQHGSSTRIGRLLLVSEPPQIDADEITDKGYVSQRAVRERRHADVARVHAAEPDPAVLVFP